ncbi:hypothetical protein B0H13DRAFT_2370903 [Mycena leptocephala]|nr:hypothetical protein B0H13DRAFT_2370903 [Mycena leptocephala]
MRSQPSLRRVLKLVLNQIMASSQIEITVANASEELGKANTLLQKYKRKNIAQKNKMGPGYKTGLEERIATSQRLIAQSTMTANATTLSGSPNDPIPPGPDPIDPSLAAKRPRGNYGPVHRKIVAEDLLEVVTDSIPAKMVSRFAFKWQGEEQAIESADPGSTAEEFADLCDAATDLIDHVIEVAENSRFSSHQFNWKINYNGGPINKPGPPKVKKNVPIKIVEAGKLTTMTAAKLILARTNPTMYPGCVEAGMEAVCAVLMNRSGHEKCITCDQGARGKALVSKPVPPAEDHPYLADCKCPLRGAALELWMLKMTADIEGIPRRGDAQVANHRLALNPDIPKVIASAIELTSGHDIETLLQPKMDHVQFTAEWALNELHSISRRYNSEYSPSFLLLSQKLKETMKAFINEDNGEDMDEENDEDEG